MEIHFTQFKLKRFFFFFNLDNLFYVNCSSKANILCKEKKKNLGKLRKREIMEFINEKDQQLETWILGINLLLFLHCEVAFIHKPNIQNSRLWEVLSQIIHFLYKLMPLLTFLINSIILVLDALFLIAVV